MAQNIQLKSLDGSELLYPITTAANVKYADDSTVESLKPAAAGAQVNVIETVKVDNTALEVSGKAVNIDLATPLATKQANLGGTGEGGKVVVASETAGTVSYKAIDSTPTDSSSNLVTSGGVKSALDAKLDDTQLVTTWSGTVSDTNIPSEKLVKNYVDTKVASVFRYKGSVATTADLPTTGNEVGDVWNVQTADPSFTPAIKAGDNVVWAPKGTDPETYGWDVLAGTVDLSNYYTKTETNTELAKKVDKVDGYGLSKNDFTDVLKTKLDGVAEGAQVNVIETVKVDGTALTITDKAVNVDLSGKVDKETGKALVETTKVTAYDNHIANGDIHVTAEQKTTWSAKQDALSEAQLAAVNSGITSSKVSTYDGYATTIAGKVDKLETKPTSGTYTKVTINEEGLVTEGSTLAEADIPSIHLAKISDVTATAAEVNILDGVVATTDEINKLSGLTASTTELNYVKGVTSSIQTQLNGKLTAVQAGTNVTVKTSGTGITATTPEISVANFNGTSSGCVPTSSDATKGTKVLNDNGAWVLGLTYTIVS